MNNERFKGNKKVVHDYTGLDEEGKKKLRIKYNTNEYESYEDAGAWLDENSDYVRFAINKLLNYYKYSRYKNFRLDLHQEGFLVVLDRFPKYKPGLRSVNSWLYSQLHWYIGKLIRRKYLRYYKRTVGFPEMEEMSWDFSLSPEMILIEKEEGRLKK